MCCNSCNNILRLAHDDPEVLRKAVAYLEQANKRAFWWEANRE
jgi:hypothetical protein